MVSATCNMVSTGNDIVKQTASRSVKLDNTFFNIILKKNDLVSSKPQKISICRS